MKSRQSNAPARLSHARALLARTPYRDRQPQNTVNQEWLIRFVEHRIGGRRIIRLIRKWLRAGVMEEGS